MLEECDKLLKRRESLEKSIPNETEHTCCDETFLCVECICI